LVEVIETELLVIGSEGAGASAAIEAARHGVEPTIVTKGRIGHCGATVTIDGDLDVDSRSLHDQFHLKGADPRDSKAKFFEDMVRGGKFLNNQRIVETHVEDAPKALQALIDWGAPYPELNRVMHASGHTYARGAWCPGPKITPAYVNEVRKQNVKVVEDTMVTDLLTNEGRVVGAVGLDLLTGAFRIFRSKAVVIATGGGMRIYPYTTAPEELSGDGFAMAYRAGAELINMEFPMFLPGVFVWPPGLTSVDIPFILSTAGEFQGWMLNRNGERFMSRWAPKTMEWTTRDICSVAMMTEILEGRGSPHGGIYVSFSHLPKNLVDHLFDWMDPEIAWKYGGFDVEKYVSKEGLRENALEAAPACHYWNGGIRITVNSETNVPGLFAGGEVQGGTMGANRLSGNAATECIVWGLRAGRFAAEYSSKAKKLDYRESQVKELQAKLRKPLEDEGKGISPVPIRLELQKLAWEKVGVLRTTEGLQQAISEIERIKKETVPKLSVSAGNSSTTYNKEWIHAIELPNMLLVLEMVARGALMREESRGACYRREYPETDYPNWTKETVIAKVRDQMTFRTEPVTITKLPPPTKKLPYGATSE
jgi:succinate dehydrogenase/fumarate reductase flavoprotein subunit